MGVSVAPEQSDPQLEAVLSKYGAGKPASGQSGASPASDPELESVLSKYEKEPQEAPSSKIGTLARDFASRVAGGFGRLVGEIPRDVGRIADNLSDPGMGVDKRFYVHPENYPGPVQPSAAGNAIRTVADPIANTIEAIPNAAERAIAPSNPNPGVPGWARRVAQTAGEFTGQGLAGAAIGGATALRRAPALATDDVAMQALRNAARETAARDPVAFRDAVTKPGALAADVMPGFSRGVATMDPEAAQQIGTAMQTRNAGQFGRLESALRSAAGVTDDNVGKSLDEIDAWQTENGRNNYAKAMSGPGVKDARALELLQRPGTMQKALRDANLAAVDNGEPPLELPKPNDRPVFPNGMKVPDELISADPVERQKFFQSQGITVPQGPGEVPIRIIDRVKKVLDQYIQSGLDGDMKPLGQDRAIGLMKVRDELVKMGDAANPDWAIARQTHADAATLKNAAGLARSDFSGAKARASDVNLHVSMLPEPAQQLYRATAVDEVLQRIKNLSGSETGSRDLVKQAFSSIGGNEKLRAMMGSDAQYQQFADQAQAVADQVASSRFFQNQSATVNKAAEVQKVRDAIQAAGGNATPPTSLLGKVAQVGQAVMHPARSGAKFVVNQLAKGQEAREAAQSAQQAAVARAMAGRLAAPVDQTMTALQAMRNAQQRMPMSRRLAIGSSIALPAVPAQQP